MFDESTDPQASEPPTNTGGGNAPLSDAAVDDEAQVASEPPTNTGGGGSSA